MLRALAQFGFWRVLINSTEMDPLARIFCSNPPVFPSGFIRGDLTEAFQYLEETYEKQGE